MSQNAKFDCIYSENTNDTNIACYAAILIRHKHSFPCIFPDLCKKLRFVNNNSPCIDHKFQSIFMNSLFAKYYPLIQYFSLKIMAINKWITNLKTTLSEKCVKEQPFGEPISKFVFTKTNVISRNPLSHCCARKFVYN